MYDTCGTLYWKIFVIWNNSPNSDNKNTFYFDDVTFVIFDVREISSAATILQCGLDDNSWKSVYQNLKVIFKISTMGCFYLKISRESLKRLQFNKQE